MVWTVGVSYDDFDEVKTRVKDLNPKVGLRWSLTEDLQLRIAGYSTLKPPLATSQTLQPTEIAGFNQFFDDINGTRSTTYAIGLDFIPATDVHTGLEIFKRNLDVPISDTGESIDSDEVLYRGYVYWMPLSEVGRQR